MGEGAAGPARLWPGNRARAGGGGDGGRDGRTGRNDDRLVGLGPSSGLIHARRAGGGLLG